jgi:hypothetical protein
MHKRHLTQEQICILARKMCKKKKVLSRADVVRLLRRWQGMRTQRELAVEMGINDVTLSQIVKPVDSPGSRNPTDRVLNLMGLKVQVVYAPLEPHD